MHSLGREHCRRVVRRRSLVIRRMALSRLPLTVLLELSIDEERRRGLEQGNARSKPTSENILSGNYAFHGTLRLSCTLISGAARPIQTLIDRMPSFVRGTHSLSSSTENGRTMLGNIWSILSAGLITKVHASYIHISYSPKAPSKARSPCVTDVVQAPRP